MVVVDPARHDDQELVDKMRTAANPSNAQTVRSAVITANDEYLEQWGTLRPAMVDD